jgi:hypothetical protein
MNYSELVQLYYERSTALQWYWTIYIFVIGGVLGFSTLRQKPEIVTTVLASLLYLAFAYKNLGAIEATATEREAVLAVVKSYPAPTDPNDVTRLRTKLEPQLHEYDVPGARYFHLGCDVLTVLFLWAKEWKRRTGNEPKPS